MLDYLEIGYQLTAYERFGSVGHNELMEYAIDEMIDDLLNPYDSIFDLYNEYLTECNDVAYEYMENFDDYINTLTPAEAFELGSNSDLFNYNDDCFRYDVRLESYNIKDVESEALSDSYFIEWLIDSDHLNLSELEEYEDDIINYANELIAQGY